MSVITPEPPWPPDELPEPEPPPEPPPGEEPPWTGDPIQRGEVQELARDIA